MGGMLTVIGTVEDTGWTISESKIGISQYPDWMFHLHVKD